MGGGREDDAHKPKAIPTTVLVFNPEVLESSIRAISSLRMDMTCAARALGILGRVVQVERTIRRKGKPCRNEFDNPLVISNRMGRVREGDDMDRERTEVKAGDPSYI